MTQQTKDYALEELQKNILFGFENEEELFERISDVFSEEDELDEDWLENEIDSRFEQHIENSKKWPKPTDFHKLVAVFDQLSREKIVSIHKAGYTRQDAESDCQETIRELKENGIIAKGYCYYHTQDLERAIEKNGTLFIGYDSVNQDDDIAKTIASRIVELLEKKKFKVEWNGSLDSRIQIIDINCQKVYDEDEDYSGDRVIELLTNEEDGDSIKRFWEIWK